MESFKSNLRSVLIANNNRILIDNLQACYYDLTNERIRYDYKKYSKLEEFLRTLTDTCKLEGTQNGTLVSAIIKPSQSGIKSLVQNQKHDGSRRADRIVFPRQLISNQQNTFSSVSNSSYGRKFSSDRKTNYNNSNKENINSSSNSNFSSSNKSNFSSSNKSRFRSNFNNNSRRTSTNTNSSTCSKYVDNKSNSNNNSRRTSTNTNSPTCSKYVSNDNNFKSRTRKFIENYVNKPKDNRRGEVNSNIGKLIYEIKKEEVDYKSILKDFVKKNNLDEPRYVNTETPVNDKKAIGHLCQLFIGELFSYTTEIAVVYETKQDAERAVSRMALDDLKKLDLSFTKSTVDNDDEFINNTFELLKDKNSAILDKHLFKEYSNKFKKTPKNDWIDVLKKSVKFKIESTTICSKVYYLISANKINGRRNAIDNKNQIENKIKLKSIRELPELIDLKLSMDSDWQVAILNITDDVKVILRLIDEQHVNEFDALIGSLDRYYVKLKRGKKPDEIKLDNYYVAVIDEKVFRVQTQKYIDDKISCLFIDDGFVENLNADCLFEMESQFLTLPAQAFEVLIEGFDFIEDLSEIKKTAIKKFFQFKVMELGDPLCLIAKPFCSNPITCIFFDTSNPNIDVNLNESLTNFIDNYLLSSKYSYES